MGKRKVMEQIQCNQPISYLRLVLISQICLAMLLNLEGQLIPKCYKIIIWKLECIFVARVLRNLKMKRILKCMTSTIFNWLINSIKRIIFKLKRYKRLSKMMRFLSCFPSLKNKAVTHRNNLLEPYQAQANWKSLII